MSVELKFPEVRNYISGHFVDSSSKKLDVVSPLDGTLLSKVPISGVDTLNQAVEAARKAFPIWSSMPIKERVQ
ncbi:MAG: aldehyde dehydrogenase family protein, partial [Cyclobacteriaceae bacterium]